MRLTRAASSANVCMVVNVSGEPPPPPPSMSVCVRVCMCVCERERVVRTGFVLLRVCYHRINLIIGETAAVVRDRR